MLRDKVVASLEQKNQILVKIFNRREINADTVTEQLLAHAERIAPYVVDAPRLLNNALDEGKVVLFEGCAGPTTWTSTTAPTLRHQLEPDRRRRLHRHRCRPAGSTG